MADIANITLKGESKAKNFIDEALRGDIAYEELSTTVSKTGGYVAGDHLIYLGQYYEVVADIAQGGTIVTSGAGQNVEEREVGDEIKKNKTQVVAQMQTLTNQVTDISDEIADMNNVLGAKNLLPNNATSVTKNGVTFTVNSDGSVTVNGTASAYTQFDLNTGVEYKEGKYALNGCPSGGGSSTYVIWVRNLAVTVGVTDGGNGATLNVTNADTFKASIVVYSGATVNNFTFYPMLRLASITDDTYAPYSMTNREMTPYVQAISNPNLLDNPWFTVNQRGQSSYSIANQYSYDRWLVFGSSSVSKNNEIITLSNTDITKYSIISQRLENSLIDNLRGRTVTLSILLSDNSIVKGSAIIPTSNPSDASTLLTVNITSDSKHSLLIYYTGSIWEIRVQIRSNYATGQENLLFKAIKLELGSVSTLAMDTAPNMATELLKCKRYFQRIRVVNTGVLGPCIKHTAAKQALVYIPSAFRALPTVSFTGAFALGTNNVTEIQIFEYTAIFCVLRLIFASELTDVAFNTIASQLSYIELSADL